jgi:hypothetical protein
MKHDPVVVDALRTKLSVIDKTIADKQAEVQALEQERRVVQGKLKEFVNE